MVLLKLASVSNRPLHIESTDISATPGTLDDLAEHDPARLVHIHVDAGPSPTPTRS